MKFMPQAITTRQALATVIIGVFVFSATFSMTLGMQRDERGNMSNCPFMYEQTSVCSMGFVEHIAKWQQLFTVTFPESGEVAFVIFLVITFVYLAVFARAPNISGLVLPLFPPVPKNKPEAKLFNYLVIAFSQGILNPKIY